MTNPVADRLRARIALEGPVTVATFMAETLSHPEHGYYIRQDPFGAAGDFVTAPEISQMFGELIGLWCAHTWHQMGAPSPVNLIEIGPGRGTLLVDAWRAIGAAPDFRGAARVHLVETSPILRDVQRRTLERSGVAGACWHNSLAEVPAGPFLLVANELFDALPVHQFVRVGTGWRERLVATDEDGAFRFVLDRYASPRAALIPEELWHAPEGSVAEVSPASISLAAEIGSRVRVDGGVALIIDYGPCRSEPGDTLQALRRHRPHLPLEDVGNADLTAHVDFATVALAAEQAGARTHGPVPQGQFLRRLGIEARAASLLKRASAEQASDIVSACRRLIDPEQMGTLFKALALGPPHLATPIGFDALEEGAP